MVRNDADSVGEPLRVASLLAYARSADQLVKFAASAVRSFYISPACFRPDTPTTFVGFVRDSLPEALDTGFSTGGASLVADLWELDPLVPSFLAIDADESLRDLLACRTEATERLADNTYPIQLSGTFGKPNPLTASHIAYQMAKKGILSDRGIIFGALTLGSCSMGWPKLAHVEKPHPYVAYRVLRCATALLRAYDAAAIVDALDDRQPLLDRANVHPPADVDAALNNAADTMKEIALPELRRRYLEQARAYLWEQHGYSSSGSSQAPSSLNYDPVGACFGLDILVAASDLYQDDGDARDFSRRIGEYTDLITITVRHVLGAMTPSGSLAYGLPFSYDVKGMGAFATSVSGLAALARVLNHIFQNSRRSFYPNAEFLNILVAENADLLTRLFRLPSAFLGSARFVDVDANILATPLQVKGWSTDRAPSLTRVESWVTVDVLLFSIYLRLLIQEVAQFLVVRKYNAKQSDERVSWPYDPTKDPADPLAGDSILQDPDETDVTGPTAANASRLAPVQFLHRTFREFMRPDSTRWSNEKSTVLLFGPPGTTKTTIVKTLAKSLGWHYMELTPSNFVEHGLELIEHRAKEIFEELGVLRETVILFDELDSLLTDRELLLSPSILNFSVPAMLPKLQQLSRLAKKQRLLIVFATNFYNRLDPALVRRGRVDERFLVLPHNEHARRRFLRQKKLGLTPAQIEKGVAETALAVFEDLKRYAEEVRSGVTVTYPIAGITPTLYFSRIPQRERQREAVRSTERLAVEVCEVAARLLDQPRELTPDTSRQRLETRLKEIKTLLRKSRAAEKESWTDLCDSLLGALRGAEPVTAPRGHRG